VVMDGTVEEKKWVRRGKKSGILPDTDVPPGRILLAARRWPQKASHWEVWCSGGERSYGWDGFGEKLAWMGVI